MNTDNANSEYKIPDMAPELMRGPQWLQEKRTLARDAFNSSPLPRRGLHLWRYTDPNRFMVDRASVVDSAYTEDYDAVEKVELRHLEQGRLSGLVTDLGGREINRYGVEKLAEQGILVTSLSEAVGKYKVLVEPYLYRLVNSATGKFEALNGALWNDGIFIYVPRGKSVAKPLHLLREAGRENSAQFPRLLIVVDQGSELTVIDEYGGGSHKMEKGLSYANSAVEIFGMAGSRIRYVNLQRQTSAMNSYLTHRAMLERDANMLTIILAFGGLLNKQNFGAILSGQNAESNMFGLTFGSGHQHFDCHTLQHHAAGQTLSNIDHKVVLRDKARSAYTGLIKIEKNARTCEAYQENRNLLLNKGTRAETIPELEILNEDVRCSHGATIGPIDPMEVFYLSSRGIPYDDAVRMVVGGFVEKTLKQVPDDLRERLRQFVNTRLEKI
ncbi:MAG: Fe-S cluster assembly protein SufD [candidate division Zixibacteria bacterium]|nr:Fe-S cluster assembly protein SufD [candidate division Zixibacteria bacterium]